MRILLCIYILYFFCSYYFARPHKLQRFNFNRAEIKLGCLYFCLSVEIKKILTSFTASFGGRRGSEVGIFHRPGEGGKSLQRERRFPPPSPSSRLLLKVSE